VPAAAWLGIRYRWAERLLVAGAFLSTTYLVDINFVSMEAYRGDTRGFEFGVTDWMMIALVVVMVRAPRWRSERPAPSALHLVRTPCSPQQALRPASGWRAR